MIKGISFAKDFSSKHKDSLITFVGYSKGGAEATAAAVATNKDALLLIQQQLIFMPTV